MKTYRLTVAIGLASLCSACASGLNSHQKSELQYYEAQGQAVTEKNPGTAAALGLLPGGGSFYGREYGWGVTNLLTWPLSILWDPVSGHNAAEAINYQATRVHVNKLRQKDLEALDDRLKSGEIDLTQHTLEKRQVEKKYAYN